MKAVSWGSIQRYSLAHTTREAYVLFFFHPFFIQMVACPLIHSWRIETNPPHSLFCSCSASFLSVLLTMYLGHVDMFP